MKYLLLMMLSFSVGAQTNWEYKLDKTAGVFSIESNNGEEYSNIILQETENNADILTMEFKMKAFNYFTKDNIGHILVAVGARDLGSAHSGSGVILGNVSKYRAHGECAGNKRINSLSVETLYPSGNCVYPDDTGVTFRDGVEYTIRVSVYKNGDVFARVEDEFGYSGSIDVQTQYKDVSKTGNLWGITEVMSKHDWSVFISEPIFSQEYQ